jgi:hypothetical protein
LRSCPHNLVDLAGPSNIAIRQHVMKVEKRTMNGKQG